MSITIREMTPDEFQRMVDEDKADRERNALSEDNIMALRRYIDQKIPPGGFLLSVLCNDLKDAAGRADMYNRRKLFEYVEYLYNHAPSICWGSKENVNAWLEVGMAEGKQ